MAPEADSQLPFDWDGTPSPDPAMAPAPIAPRSRRFTPRLVALALAAALVGGGLAVALAGGGSGGGGGPVALAASVTNREPGFKFDLTISATVSGQTTSVEASGAFNTGPPLSGSMDATVGATTVSELIVGSDLYVQTPQSDGRWLHSTLPSGLGAAGSSGGGATELTSADPGQTLQYLRAAGTVSDLGPVTIGGVSTTHYHADIDLSRYASTLPASQQAAAQADVLNYKQLTGSSILPMDVWVDDSNLVRQIQFSFAFVSGASAAFTMNFSDYGPQPAVSAPAASDVINATPTPSTPAQTPPLSSPPANTPNSGAPAQAAD